MWNHGRRRGAAIGTSANQVVVLATIRALTVPKRDKAGRVWWWERDPIEDAAVGIPCVGS